MSLITGKIEKAYLARNFFYFPERRNPRHFKLGAWRTAKTRACLLRLNALKLMEIFLSSTPLWGQEVITRLKMPSLLTKLMPPQGTGAGISKMLYLNHRKSYVITNMQHNFHSIKKEKKKKKTKKDL